MLRVPMRPRVNRATREPFWSCQLRDGCFIKDRPSEVVNRGRSWLSRLSGKITRVVDMGDEHLRNTIALLERTEEGRAHPALPFMRTERIRRDWARFWEERKGRR